MSLLEAASSANLPRLQEIISRKKEKCREVRDNHSWTAIHHAVSSREPAAVRLLLDNSHYFDIRAQSFEGWTALYLALCRPNVMPVEIIRMLLEADPTLHSIKDNEDVSPMHRAVQSGREDLVELLIEFGADVNTTDLDQETPLHYAAREGNLSVVKVLIEKGKANAKLVNHVDFDPICLLFGMPFTDERKLDILKYLMPHAYTEHPSEPGYYGVHDFLKAALLSCRLGNNIISSYFIENFYCLKYNSKYELIAELEPVSIISHTLCLFLHDEIRWFDQFYSQIFRHLDIESSIIKIILCLLVQEDAEKVKFASRITRELLNIDFDSLLKEEFLYQHPPDFEVFLGKFKPPFPPKKRLFQFICSLIDLHSKVFDLLMGCVSVCDIENCDILENALQLFLPFIVNNFQFVALLQECCGRNMLSNIEEYVPQSLQHVTIRQYHMKPQVLSLRRLTRDVIRKQVSVRVPTATGFFKIILAMPLPVTLKCYLLHIQDTSWIQDLSFYEEPEQNE